MGFNTLTLFFFNMAIVKAINDKKKKEASKNEQTKVCLEAQELLVETLNDSPHLASLAGTEWEVRSLRFGTQYLIAQEVIKINKVEHANYGDIVKQFAINIPSLIKIITLCLLNDKHRIYKDGIESNGFSDEYYSIYDTIQWEGNIKEYATLLLECLQLLDVSAFFSTLDIVFLFSESVTRRKTTMKEQK